MNLKPALKNLHANGYIYVCYSDFLTCHSLDIITSKKSLMARRYIFKGCLHMHRV